MRILSYLIPGPYGVSALQDLLFRGIPAQTWIIGGLALYALVLAVASRWAVRRDVVGAR